jgi:hypothetical protein
VDRLRPRAHCPVPWHVPVVIDGPPDRPETVRTEKTKVLDRRAEVDRASCRSGTLAFCVSFEGRFGMYDLDRTSKSPGPIDPA